MIDYKVDTTIAVKLWGDGYRWSVRYGESDWPLFAFKKKKKKLEYGDQKK